MKTIRDQQLFQELKACPECATLFTAAHEPKNANIPELAGGEEPMKKYELTNETVTINNKVLYRIRALVDIPEPNVKAGDLGGFVETENNLSHDGACWIFDDACVFGKAVVRNNAIICDGAFVHDNAIISGNATICDYACVSGSAYISGKAIVCGKASVRGNAQVSDTAVISENARISGDAWVLDNATVSGDARVSGLAHIYGKAWIHVGARISGGQFFSK